MKKKKIFFFIIIACCAGKVLIIDNFKYQANDFAPLYVAAQLIAEGRTTALYDHHPHLFNIVPPGVFKKTAKQVGFKGILTPYVHLPLFSLLTRPLLVIPYSTITKLLLMINVLTVLLSLYLITRLTGTDCNLTWLGCALVALAFFYPMRYSLRLGQTTPLVFLGITVLYYLYKTGRPKISGLILGGIICLKITPLIFLVYFMVRRKWSLVISSSCAIVLILMASTFLMGWENNDIFIQNIIRLSGYSLASWNNQSLDGFLLRLVTGALHLYDWHIVALPLTIKILKYAIASVLMILWLVTILTVRETNDNQELLAFSLTVTLMIVLSPISWIHYFLFLVFPFLVLFSALIRNNTIPYRRLMIGGLLLSYPALALPPSYFLKLINFPLVNTIPLPVLSSAGFFGGMLLMSAIFLYTAFTRGTNEALEQKTL